MKHKLILLSFLCTSFYVLCGQAPQTAMEIAQQEKAFADMAQRSGVQQSFVKYFSDSSFVFRQGKIMNGMDIWKNNKPDSTLLKWYPVVADISISGDFGYTTGPFQFRSTRDKTNPEVIGYYYSVWKKEKDGAWKVVFDDGIAHAPAKQEEDRIRVSKIKSEPPSMPELAVSRELILTTEREFLDKYRTRMVSDIKNYISDEARFYRPEVQPVIRKDSIQALLKKENGAYEYVPAGADFSSSGDMGYVYGYVKDTKATDKPDMNYFRIWKKEKGAGWKIVLDAVSFGG